MRSKALGYVNVTADIIMVYQPEFELSTEVHGN